MEWKREEPCGPRGHGMCPDVAQHEPKQKDVARWQVVLLAQPDVTYERQH